MTFLWPSLIPIRKGMGAEATSSIGAGRMGTKTWCQMKGFLRRQAGEGGIQGGDGGVDGLGKRGKALGDEDDTPRNRTLRRSILLAHQGGEDEHQGLDVELLDERGEFDLRVGRTRSPIHR